MSTTESLLIVNHDIRNIEKKIESLSNYFKDCTLRNDKNDVEAKHILTLLKMETSSAVAALTKFQAMLAGLEVTVSAEKMNCDPNLDTNESLAKLLSNASRSLSTHSSSHNSRSKSSKNSSYSKSNDKSKVPSPKSQSSDKSGCHIDEKSKGIKKSSKSGSNDNSHRASGKSSNTNLVLPAIEKAWSTKAFSPSGNQDIMLVSPTSPSATDSGNVSHVREIPMISLEPRSKASSSSATSKRASSNSTRSSRSNSSSHTNTSTGTSSQTGSNSESASSNNNTTTGSMESGISSDQQSTSSEHTNNSEESSVESSNNSCKCGLSHAELNAVQTNQVNSTQKSPEQNTESLPVSIDLSQLPNTNFPMIPFRFKERKPISILPKYSLTGSPDANGNFPEPQFSTPFTVPKRRIANPYFFSNPFGRPSTPKVVVPQAISNNEQYVPARKQPRLHETALHTAENIRKIINSHPAPTYPYLNIQEHC